MTELLLAEGLLERQLRQDARPAGLQRVVLDLLVDERQRRLVGGAVLHVVRERGADLRLEDVVHELVARSSGASRPSGSHIASTHWNAPDFGMTYCTASVVGLDLEHVARVGLRHDELAGLQRILVVRGDLLDLLLQADEVLLGLVEVVLVRACSDPCPVRTAPCRTRRAPRRGTSCDCAPTASLRASQSSTVCAHLLRVVADAGGAPLPRDRVLVAGVVGRVLEPRVEVLPVRDQRRGRASRADRRRSS